MRRIHEGGEYKEINTRRRRIQDTTINGLVVAGVSVSTRGSRISSSLIVRKETYAIKGSDIFQLKSKRFTK